MVRLPFFRQLHNFSRQLQGWITGHVGYHKSIHSEFAFVGRHFGRPTSHSIDNYLRFSQFHLHRACNLDLFEKQIPTARRNSKVLNSNNLILGPILYADEFPTEDIRSNLDILWSWTTPCSCSPFVCNPRHSLIVGLFGVDLLFLWTTSFRL